MRRTRLHPLIVVLCAFFLLGAQQAAYAHFLGHLGTAVETTARDGGDTDHGAASSLSHICTTCAAFAALDAPPSPAVVAALPPPAATQAVLPGRRFVTVLAPSALPYAPRAPPVVP